MFFLNWVSMGSLKIHSVFCVETFKQTKYVLFFSQCCNY